MSDKFSKKLTMGERFLILGALPQPDFVTFKILRKLKESLSPSEEEIKVYEFKTLFQCPHREYDGNGKADECEYQEEGIEQPACPIHKELMKSAGRVSWSPKMRDELKEIFFGAKALELIVTALKGVSEEAKKQNGDLMISLYEKFSDEEGNDGST